MDYTYFNEANFYVIPAWELYNKCLPSDMEKSDWDQLEEVKRKMGRNIPKHDRSHSLPVIHVLDTDAPDGASKTLASPEDKSPGENTVFLEHS